MAGTALLETLRRIAEPVIISLGLELWGIEIAQTGRCLVRIYVDAPPDVRQPEEHNSSGALEEMHSVSVDQCAHISRLVALALDVEEVFSGAYVLEVSSPGLSRTFFKPEQLPPYVGDEVELTLQQPHPDWEGRKRFRGILIHVADGQLTVSVPLPPQENHEDASAPLTVSWDALRRISRVHTFFMPEKPGRRKRAAGQQHAQ